MSGCGIGGVKITEIAYTEKFKQDFKKLSIDISKEVEGVLTDLLKHPFPRSLGFEKLKGGAQPIGVYSTRNIKSQSQTVIRNPELNSYP
jgi:mRNA-degrading endonuclease YafQ of YafQ-DinJ toxin-antitoxin module